MAGGRQKSSEVGIMSFLGSIAGPLRRVLASYADEVTVPVPVSYTHLDVYKRQL